MTKKKDETATVGPGGKAVAPFVVPGASASALAVGAPAAAPPAFAPPGSPAAAAAAAAFPAGGPVPITGEVRADDFAMQLYLKGSDVPQGESQVRVRVQGFVKIAGSRSPLVAQIEPTFGKSYLPLNKTNIKQIAAITQNNDLRCIIGRILVLVVYPVPNPTTGQMARGLFVGGAE
jgi:hypothetical protein